MSSSPVDDPYKILGLDQTATATEIRSAHRKLVLKCHPDKVQDETLRAEFYKIQGAYELLSDEEARAKYHERQRQAELRAKLSSQAKANSSSPRTPKSYGDVFEVRTSDVPRSPYSPSSPRDRDTKPRSKSYYTTYKSTAPYDDDDRYSQAEPVRGDPRYAERVSHERLEREYRRRVAEREREREQQEADMRKQKERERRRDKDAEKESARRAEKDKVRDARHSDRKARDKERNKTMRRDVEEKRKYREAYIDPLDDEAAIPRSSSNRSTTRRADERRDEPLASPILPEYDKMMDNTHQYMTSVRTTKPGGLQRSHTYHERVSRAPAPTPPITKSPTKPPYTVGLDDDVRRSSAVPSRRGSEDVAGMSARQKSSTSPPRPGDLPRHNTMPVEAGFGSRPPPQINRSATFNSYGESELRGRGRSRMSSQAETDDIEFEILRRQREREYYERERERDHIERVDRERERDRKLRSGSKSAREPSSSRSKSANVSRYSVTDNGTSRLSSQSYLHEMVDPIDSYPTRSSRPPLSRENHSSHIGATSGSSSSRYKVKTSKSYEPEDFIYSQRYAPQASFA